MKSFFNVEIKLLVLSIKYILHKQYRPQTVTFDQSYRYHDIQNGRGVKHLFTIRLVGVGRDSPVDIALSTGWTVRQSNAGGGGDFFRTRPDRAWGPPSLLYNGYRVSFPGVKRTTRGVHQPPRTNADVKEEAELPNSALMACSSVYLTFCRMSLCTSQLGHGVSSICT